jgi:hypothetical protein
LKERIEVWTEDIEQLKEVFMGQVEGAITNVDSILESPQKQLLTNFLFIYKIDFAFNISGMGLVSTIPTIPTTYHKSNEERKLKIQTNCYEYCSRA